MFAGRYFAATYFAPRYFPKLGGTIVAGIARLRCLLGIGQ